MKPTILLRLAFAAAAAFGGSAGATVFAPNPNDFVRSILPLPDGDILVGGTFSQIGGAPHNYLARLDEDGNLDASFTGIASGGTSYGVMAIVRQPDGKILIGGSFDQVDGVPRKGLARLNADGSLDTSFAALDFAGDGSTPDVGGVLLQADGKILVFKTIDGYGFNSINGQPFPAGIARLNGDGTLDSTFALPGSADGGPDSVYSAALQADGKILLGGSYGGQHGVLRLNANGSLDPSFQTANINNLVTEVLVQSDGAVVISGRFTTPFRGLARLRPDGSLDNAFDAATRLNFSEINQILQQGDGKLLLSGGTAYVSTGYPKPAVVRLDPDGTIDTSFADPKIVYAIVVASALQADGKVLTGGYFYEAGGGYPRKNLARLNSDGTIDIPVHTVTPAAGANGSLSPSTPQSVHEGETTRFTIQPDAGYRLDAVDGCGGSIQGPDYVTGPVTADCTVSASFVADPNAPTFVVNTAVSTGTPLSGSLSPAGPQTVRFGQTISFTLVPSTGYYVSAASGCNGTLNGDVYTTGPIAADCTVTAEFVAPGRVTLGGTPQTAVTGLPFATPLKVRVLGAFPAVPVRGVQVSFQAPAGGPGALLSASTATTDANGEASVTAVANGVGGSYAVKAVVTGLESAPSFFLLSNEAIDGPGIELQVTLSADPPPACGASAHLEVTPGTPVNYCFTLTNRTSTPLNYHSLQHSPWAYFWTLDSDQALYLQPLAIAAQSTVRYHITTAATADSMDEEFTWTAFAAAPGYHADTNATEAFVDISGTGQAVISEALGVTDLPVPFPLTYFGTTFRPDSGDHLCVNNSGTLRLVPGFYTECPSTQNSVLTPPFVGDNGQTDSDYTDGILPYWDVLGDNGAVYVQTVGAAPNRRLIVQWDRKDHASVPNPAGGITFEAIVDEDSGTIRYVYRDLDFDDPSAPSLSYGGSATIGLIGTNPSVDGAVDVAPPLHDGQSIVFSPTSRPHIATAATHLQVGTPRVQAPASLAASAARQQSVTRMLDIANTGNLTLDWSLDRAAAAGHFPETQRWVLPPERSGLPYRPSTHPQSKNASASTRFAPASAAFDVPAYGAMIASTTNHLGGANYVTFNANNPTELTPVFFNSVGTQGGDFIRDDFSQQYILYSPNEGDAVALLRLDYTDFQAYQVSQPLTTMPANGQRLSGLAWDRSTDTLFASSAMTGGQGQPCDEQVAFGSSALYTIDPDTGEQRTIGAIHFDDARPLCVTDIAVSPGGQMYGIDLLNDALVAIDKTNGRAALIGSLGFDIQDTNSIDFDDASGVLYLAAGYYPAFGTSAGGGLYTIDLVTGVAQRISPYPLRPNQHGYLQIDALSIARAGGACAYPGEIAWLRFDVAEGRTSPGARSPVTVTFDAGGLEAGEYSANICIDSNDRAHSLLAVPVAFTVTNGDGGAAIFRDGFDGTVR
ncbi:hypothetical protein [Dokdonella sp.]|uniref:hypothetical protein n=1 Tax=Dokdonella sp. TaxID=2291710 RepID=UPI001B07E982|nr:hypothetical protein [Dokdonella sp.]MBO9662517.1 hypothetical protein [Dokdonella sp.]